MTRNNISQVIGNISDRHVEEAMDHKVKEKGNMWLRFGPIAACLCLCALIGLGVWQSGIFHDAGVVTSDGGDTENNNVEGMKFTDSTVKTRGTKFTDNEILNYINDNSEHIITAMQREYGFPIDSVSVYKKGVYHISLDDNTVILDAVTLPILVNGKIYAFVDMVRAGDETVTSLGLGGKKWENYNKVLFDDPKTDVVFAYLPKACGEILLFPNNTFADPRVGAVKSSAEVYGKGVNWYERFKTDDNILSAEDLMNSDNIVNIYKK